MRGSEALLPQKERKKEICSEAWIKEPLPRWGGATIATSSRYVTMIAFMAFPFSLEFFLTLYPFKWHALLTCRVKKSVSSVASGSCTVCATRNAADHSSSSSDGIANKICEVRQAQHFRQVISSGRVAEQAAAYCASPTVSETCFAALFL